MKSSPIPPLSIFLIFSCFWTACDYFSNASTETVQKNTAPTRYLRELNYVDNGAVVPMPTIRRVQILLPDSMSANLKFSQYQNGETDIKPQEIPVSGDLLHDLLTEIDRLELKSTDGMDVKMGKRPCVGTRNLDVAMVYSTGDTVRYSVLGEARCDRSLYPHLWVIDSITQVLTSR
jgi:hypothetical protein